MDYYAIIVCIILFLLAIFGKMVYKNLVNPITIFLGVWGAILFLYSFRLYEINKASENCITIILIGCFSFFLGAIFTVFIRAKKGLRIPNNIEVHQESKKPDYLYFTILNCISILFLMGFAVETIRMLRSGFGFDYIHYYYNQEVGTIGAERTSQNILNWFVWPLTLSTLPIIAVVFQAESVKTKLRTAYLVTSIVNVTMYVIITGTRASIAYLVVYFILFFYVQGRKLKIRLGRKIAFFVAGIVIIWAFNYMTISRGSDSVLKTIYIYFCGCVPNLSNRLDQILRYEKMHGFVSSYGFYRPIMLIANRFLHSQLLYTLRATVDALIRETQIRVMIGPGIRYNAFVSPFYYFILDGGYLAVVIYSFIYGVFCSTMFFRYIRDKSYKNIVLYLLVIFGIAFSMVRFHFVQMRYVLSFVYAALGFSSFKRSVRFTFNKTA